MILAYATSDTRRVLRMFAPLRLDAFAMPGSATTWIDLAHVGEWHGHRSGPFRFTREIFQQCVDNLARQANPIPLYFGHEDDDAVQNGLPEPEAKGWVHELDVRGDRLWARVELGALAAAGVKRGGWKFSSGYFNFESTDRVTAEPIGCQLISVALANRPFIDGQHPIELSATATPARDAIPEHDATVRHMRVRLANLPRAVVDAAIRRTLSTRR